MRRSILGWGVFLAFFSSGAFDVPYVVHAQDNTSTSYQVLGPVMSSGGYGTSDHFILFSSISEFAHDIGSASPFTLNPGFIAYPFVSTPAVSATAGDSQVALTWTASQGYIGWTVSGYDVGQSTISGGPYSYSSIGNVTSSTRTGLTNGTTYYFVITPKDTFGTRIATSTQVSATPTASSLSSPSSGGGGGGGSINPSIGATITVSGRAYPLSRVTVLKDGQIAVRTIAGPDALFNISLTNLSTGIYTVAIYSEDNSGNRSTTFLFPVQVTPNATTDA